MLRYLSLPLYCLLISVIIPFVLPTPHIMTPKKLKVGSHIPAIPESLQDFDGVDIPLAHSEKPTLICFLRHLA